ncbi:MULTISPECIES: ABC transporter permease [Vibrio]|uniref:ABC transporter permease subunit n=1 Tax=Vibrio casei TaxID=673372 RepID=A0A368LNG3_9VIBR|nr:MULTISPECIES: ABC transporter permease subunit [Vibrio]RCS73368.1 ABC transporter permease subunit [Vibrio casei]SJN17512.1 Peptide transport system permease protein SapB [Vibrio casei]HBV75844.1 peptide ABC transporter permease [Vibrio sp.]
MLVYTLRRINLFIITLLILTLIGYSILRLDPLSPWAIQDFFQGWTTYLGQLSQMNLGVNLYGIPVIDEIKMVFPATLELCFFAMIFSLMVGIPIGTLAGMRQGKVLDTIISFSSMVGYSIPIFWIALMMIMFFSLNLGYTPVSGRHDLLFDVPYITGFAVIDAFLTNDPLRMQLIQNVLMHLVLPCLVLALAPTTEVIRLMRSSVAEVRKQNYIRAARIRGLSTYEIVFQHVLRNAIPPIIPKVGVQLSSMLTYAIITESIFNWPGIGRWLLEALADKDYVSIQAGVMAVATFVLLANILSDLIGAMVNPLVRKQWYAVK